MSVPFTLNAAANADVQIARSFPAAPASRGMPAISMSRWTLLYSYIVSVLLSLLRQTLNVLSNLFGLQLSNKAGHWRPRA